MSGHSKWSTIKRSKAASDARRGQLFTKLAKEIIIAAKKGGGNPDANFQLRMAVQRAKDQNMPSDSIERSIKKATGDLGGQNQMEEVVYEGYGPGGTAVLLEAVTDNKKRTVADVRNTFTKTGGNMADAGAVMWQFEQKGVIVVAAEPERAEELTLATIDAGAEDFETVDSTLQIFSSPQSMEGVRQTLADQGAEIQSSELSMVPKNTVPLDEKTAAQALRLLDKLEELEDIQRVYSNADFPESALQEYSDE